MSDSGTALSLITAAVLLRLTVGCVFKILEGLQRMDLGYKMTILGSAFEFVVAIALLSAGYGLVGLAIAYLCGELLATSVGWVLCHRLCPMLHLSPFLLTRDTFRELGSLAARFQVSSLLATGYGNGLKAVMSGLFGTSMLAAYELADKLFNLARVLSAAGFTPLMPAFANLHQAEDPGKWRSLYTIGSKAVAVVAVISLSTLVVFADQAILVWTGEEYDLVAWIIRAMFVAHFMNILTGVGTSSLRAQGSMRLEILFRINAIVLTVITAVPGTLLGGFKGFIMAFAFSFFTASAWFVIAQSRQLGPDFVRELRRLVIRSSAVGGSLILGGLLLRPLLDQLGPAWPPRWHAVFEVAVWGPLFSAIGLLALLRAIFSTEERRYLLQKIWSPAFRRRSLG
jgi:O-antigen/teichoic acid export membrane protein